MIAFKMHVLLKQYFPFQNILYNVFFSCAGKADFFVAIIPVFSVTWYFPFSYHQNVFLQSQ